MIHGFVVIDKPVGITSHDVVSKVRRIAGTRRVGHTGTLDPFATGVLPIAINDGTKVIPYLDEGIKCYDALLRLGVTTDTLDMTGAVLLENDPSAITKEQFSVVMQSFIGSINQIPPMFSAIKRDGQPLYKLARQGIEIEREPRPVQIYALELLTFALPLISLRVICSRGTYVRTLADDIGKTLGCGAALQELRRTASGLFTLVNAVTLEQFEEALKNGSPERCCLSPSGAVAHLPEILLDDTALEHVTHGRSSSLNTLSIFMRGAALNDQLVRLTYNAELKAIARVSYSAAGSPLISLKRVFN